MKCDEKAGCSELTVNLETESEDCTSGGACAMAGSSQGGAMGWSQGGGDVNILQGQIQVIILFHYIPLRSMIK